jgi:hypothetical protein
MASFTGVVDALQKANGHKHWVVTVSVHPGVYTNAYIIFPMLSGMAG